MSTSLSTLAASIAALTVGLTTLVPMVNAPTDPVYGGIEDRQTTVTVHKLETGSLTTAVTPSMGTGTGNGIDGVPFKFYRLDLDLTTSQGWESLIHQSASYYACDEQGQADFTYVYGIDQDTSFVPVSVTTANGGVAVAQLKTGAYLVCEQPTTEASNAAGNPVTVINRATPFIVTTPTPHPSGQGWLYDPHVYPKNIVLEAPVKSMEVTQPGLKVANGVSINVSTTIPRIGKHDRFNYFTVVDPMPAELINPQGFTATINDVPLIKDRDFTTTYSQGAPNNNAVGIVFTQHGLHLLEKHASKTLTVAFTATMNAVPADGQANNAAWVYAATAYAPHKDHNYRPVSWALDNSDLPEMEEDFVPGYPDRDPVIWPATAGATPGTNDTSNPPVRTRNTVGMTWSALTIHKFDEHNRDAKLAGAEFEIYVAQDQTQCQSTQTQGQAIQIGNRSTFTTARDGKILLEGVHLHTASVNSVLPPNPGTRRCFVVKEIQAPAGYALPEAERSHHAVWVETAAMDKELDIPNTRITGLPDLPLTGASGQLILTALGGGLMMGSVGAYLIMRRRQANHH